MKSVVSEQWFPPSQLAFYFDSNSWAKGTALYLQNEVVSAQMTRDDDGWRILAKLQGREPSPYTVTAQLRVSEGGKGYSVRLKDLVKRGDISANVDMRPGDILIIPQSWF